MANQTTFRPVTESRPAARRARSSTRALTTLMTMTLTLAGTFWADSAPAQEFREVEKRHLRHILVRSEAIADQVMEEYRAGAKFADLARKHSFDAVTKRLGGDLGFSNRGTYEFDDVAFAIPKTGDIAKAKTQFGWHVIYLEDVKVERVPVRPPARPTPERPEPPAVPPVTKVNKDIAVSLAFEKKAYQPGEDVFFTISMRNASGPEADSEARKLDVLHPDLWPYGLTVRYEKGRLNTELSFPQAGQEPDGGYLFTLEPGESRSMRYRLQDYAGDVQQWPIIRTNWRGNIFMGRVAALHEEFARQEGFEPLRDVWRFYATEESHLNVLPTYSSAEPWYALLYISGGTAWVRLDDAGMPGVMSAWIDRVRAELYDKVMFTVYEPGSHVAGGEGLEKVISTLPAKWRGQVGSLQRGVVGLAVAGVAGQEYVGSGLTLCLGSAPTLEGKLLPLGRIALGEGVLGRLEELCSKDPSKARTLGVTRIDVYPSAIVPESVRANLEKGPEQGEPKKATVDPQEKEPREKSASSVLPMVQFSTSHGEFVIRLFEDEAPNTVAHFISLVESGFYDGLQIDRVDPEGGLIFAGAPAEGRELDYVVPDEPNVHRHQKAAVALARRRDQKNSGGSRFYVCLTERPDLDKEWTVFGEVVSGLGSVASFPPGTVFKQVTVLTKREHPYTFNRFGKKE
ncbi:MAG: peptidylprolyl isomerase [Planctomycetota bacterium]